ncbi:MAG: DNA repair protein RecO [Candidatus Cloacimonetes bacterium]|nr:DNA repair protein RecO [Candidatus Cloacimonadota bacterium]
MSHTIEKCNAFALRITNYSNTSQIIQFFSDKFGHIDVIAKGSRSSKSKYQGLLQPLNNYEIVIYKKESTLSILKEISIIQDNMDLFNNIEKAAIAQGAAEIYLQLMFEENDYCKFYDLLESYLNYLKNVDKNHILIFWRFLLRVTKYLGFSLKIDKCQFCQTTNPDTIYGISFKQNGLICKDCIKKKNITRNFKCNKDTIKILLYLKNISNQINNLEISKSTTKEINAVFKNYLSYHLHKRIHLKSLEIL